MAPQPRHIDTIIVHVSDSPDDRDIGAKEIDQWHRERGFRMIGYHYVIRRNGVVEPGRDEYWIGAHCKGHNLTSIGICWVGRDHLTAEQKTAMIKLIKQIMDKYKLTPSQVFGHREFDAGKTCPNLDPNEIRGWLK